MQKILLAGYYGFNNIGDEAILTAVSEELKKNEIEVSCLTQDLIGTNKQNNIKTYSRNNLSQIKKALKQCDKFIMNGGSIFQDVTSSRSIYYYLGLVKLAQIMKKPVYIYAHGIGPINKNINKKLFTQIIKKVASISVRDKKSYNTLLELKIPKEKITITKDPVFMLKPNIDKEIEKIFKLENIKLDKHKKTVGISVRQWKAEENFIIEFSKIVDKLIEEYSANIVFLPFHYPEDLEFTKKIVSQMKQKPNILEKQYTPKEMIGIMKRMDIMIGVRLHSLIFSTVIAKPFIGIDYDVKIEGFLKDLDYENKIKYDKINWRDFKLKYENVIKNYDNIIKKLEKKADENKRITKKELENIIK